MLHQEDLSFCPSSHLDTQYLQYMYMYVHFHVSIEIDIHHHRILQDVYIYLNVNHLADSAHTDLNDIFSSTVP